MPVQMHRDPMNQLYLTVTATIQGALPPGLPFVADNNGKGTGVVTHVGRSSITAYFRDHRTNATNTDKAQFQQRFQNRSYAALVAELGAGRVSRVSTFGGSKGVKVTLA